MSISSSSAENVETKLRCETTEAKVCKTEMKWERFQTQEEECYNVLERKCKKAGDNTSNGGGLSGGGSSSDSGDGTSSNSGHKEASLEEEEKEDISSRKDESGEETEEEEEDGTKLPKIKWNSFFVVDLPRCKDVTKRTCRKATFSCGTG